MAISSISSISSKRALEVLAVAPEELTPSQLAWYEKMATMGMFYPGMDPRPRPSKLPRVDAVAKAASPRLAKGYIVTDFKYIK